MTHPSVATSPPERLLEGIVVCDFTRVLSGPYCTRLLADLGADVIKIERPGEGDEVRHIAPQMSPTASDQSAYFARINAGKRSIAIDFTNPQARDVVLDLVRKADVVVENFSPGVMAKYRFDEPSLRAIKPDLVYCSISGFGQTGPLRGLQAYAHLINAFSGMMDLDRSGFLAPKASNLQAADVLAGASPDYVRRCQLATKLPPAHSEHWRLHQPTARPHLQIQTPFCSVSNNIVVNNHHRDRHDQPASSTPSSKPPIIHNIAARCT